MAVLLLARRLALRSSCTSALSALMIPLVASAQQPTRDDYIVYLPPLGPIYAQSDASARWNLYGDRRAAGYADVAPADGIDDARGARLLRIAERFSPILKPNNFEVPRHVEHVVPPPMVLEVDHWQDGRRVRTDSIRLHPGVAGAGRAGANRVREADRATDDTALEALVREFHPRKASARVSPPTGAVEKILFFDAPGEGEKSWRRHWKRSTAPSGIYAHFFLDEVETPNGPRFHFEIQFWFYYPFNDSANNHEGDWEHINVCVTTSERALEPGGNRETRGLLTAGDLSRILDSPGEALLDSLVIREVDYYFHHNVMTVDYLAAHTRTAQPRCLEHISVWEDCDYIHDVIRRRVSLAGGALATHPIGYVGGNNLGPDELTRLVPRFRRSYNRNSDATYPFPGVWYTIGPLGMTEKVHGDDVPNVRAHAAREVPWDSLLRGDRYVTFRARDIVLLPDWERVEDLVLNDAAVRRRWSWLLLPVRWGFPAVESPGAGILKHTNTGNLGPIGPAFNSAWNDRGETEEYKSYPTTVLRTPTSPVTPWANLISGAGILNVPLAIWGLTPGGNVVVVQLAPWMTGTLHLAGRPPSKTFTPGSLPPRFTDAGAGRFVQHGGRQFAKVLPRQEHPEVAPLFAQGRIVREHAPELQGPMLWFGVLFARRLALENTLGWGVDEVSYHLRDDAGMLTRVRGEFAQLELTGGVRYNPISAFDDALKLYVRGGYGYLRYHVRDVDVEGRPLADASFKGGRFPGILPSSRWLPNLSFAGVGLELFSDKRNYIARRLGYGVRVDATGIRHRLQRNVPGGRGTETVERLGVGLGVILGW